MSPKRPRSWRAIAIASAAHLLTSCGQPPSTVDSEILPDAAVVQTNHFKIFTTATDSQTSAVAAAVEALYRAYSDLISATAPRQKLQLVLYKNREEFRLHNRSTPWAEAYYRAPRSYAYYAEGTNPTHWMIHEATHQLMREASGLRPAKWINEGIACYFAASRLVGSTLERGTMDPSAYPIWWLSSETLSGDMNRDIAAGRIIPLEQIVSNTGPDINTNVNLYYIHYWSITHFLFHYRNGIYSEHYKKLLAAGGDARDFVRLIGPFDKIQTEWYQYLVGLVNERSTQ